MYQLGRFAAMATAHTKRHGTQVIVHWEEVPAGRRPMDGKPLGEVTRKQDTFTAFLHFIEAKSITKQMVDLLVGDCLMDYPTELTLKGRESMWFEIAGEAWQQKKVSQRTEETYDALWRDKGTLKTMVLERRK